MGTQPTGGGSTSSFSNTPQGTPDSYVYTEDGLLADPSIYNQTTRTIFLDVMSNDLGGKAKSLFSIDDGGTGAMTDLLQSNVTTGWEQTADGNYIRINAGKIEFRINDGTNNPESALDVNTLGADDAISDTFVYAIRMANGTLAMATVSISITGTNDAATISGAATGDVIEDDDLIATGTLVVNDVDAGENELVPVAAGTASDEGYGTFEVLANGQWTYSLDDDNTTVQALAAGETLTDTITVWSEDLSASQQITITITGTNDGPVAAADTAEGGENEVLIIDVLANDSDIDNGAVLTVTSATAPSGQGTASVADNQVQFDPGTDFDYLAVGESTTVTVDYAIQDEQGTPSTSTIEITVTGTNDAPVATADIATVGENDLLLVNVLANDTDVDNGAALTVTSATAPSGQGSASVVGNQVQFDPGTDFDYLAVGESTAVVVDYEIVDEHGATSSSTLTITVTGTNDGPVAAADTAEGGENEVLLIDVLANDTDVDNGAALTVTAATAPSGQGTASVVGNQVQFDPGTDFDYLAEGETATVTVDYAIQDEHGATSSSTIEITITGTNDAPVATADIATVGENDLLLVNVLVNDTDVDGAVLTVTSATAPSGQGSASVVGNQVQFDPGTDFDYLAVGESTAVVVDYEIVDEHGAASNSTLTITVTGTNDAPVATADIAGGGENETLLVDVLANDTDVDNGSALTVTSATAPSGQGSASVVGNQVQFDPGSDFDYLAVGETATVTVDYAIQDEHGATSSSTIGITVTGTNDAPVASNGSGSTAEDAPLVGTLPAATDAEGHSIAYALENDAINGSVNVNADGSFSYTPDADFNGTDSFTFTVSDGNGGSNSYSYEITVDPVNDTPAGTNDSYATDEDTALIVAGPGVLANDGDVDGDTLESILVAGPSHGTLALSTDGSFTYTPDADYNGTDSFTYTPNDGTTDGNTVTVNLTVNAVNDAPTITSDGGADTAAVAVEENQTEVTTVASSDVDGASPVYSIAGGADSGMFAINPATGALSFVAAPDFEAPGDADGDNDYEVVVQVSDGSASDSQAITVTVSDADEGAPPVAGEDKWTLSDATIVVAGIITAAWFTQDDSDPDADPLYVTEVSGLPVGMTANYDGSGHLVDITGTTPAVGTYNLTYTLSDGSNEVTSTVAMTIVDTTSSGTDNIALDGNDFSYVDLISGNDVISGDAFLSGNAGTDWFVGNNGNDSISGGAGDDKLFGNDNLDTINGGTGNDVLSGGNGGDFFVFNTPLNAATNVDAILDFGAAENGGNQDVIQLESDIFQFGAALDASEFASNAGGTATSANAQIVHDINTGNLYYDADGTGGVEAILFATVTLSGGSLDYSDFAII